MRTQVLLIRHGITPWNAERRWQGHADVALSDEGREQAAKLGRTLARHPPTALYSSDLTRARETACIAARALDVEAIADPRWREMDIGEWSGLRREEIRERHESDWQRITDGEDLPRGGGERWSEFAARCRHALANLAAQHPGERAAIVTHGGVIRTLMLDILGFGYERLRELPVVDNTAIVEIYRDRDTGWRLVESGTLAGTGAFP